MLDSCECKHPPLVNDVIQVIWLLFQQHHFDAPFLCSLAELFLRPKVLLYSRAGFMTMCERARIVFLRIGYWENIANRLKYCGKDTNIGSI